MTTAIAAYPLSGPFRAQLDELVGERVEVLVLPELRRLGPLALLRRLAGVRGRCLLPLEDPSSEVLLPILELLAAATRARTIDVVGLDLIPRRSSRVAGIAGAAALLAASGDAQRALRAAHRDLDELLHAPRADGRPRGDDVLYVNANLWFGVKAGGSVAHVAGVVNALIERGRPVTLATAPEPIGIDPTAEIRRLPPPRFFGLPVEANLYRFGATVPRCLADLEPRGFVYQRMSVGNYAGVGVARRHNIPLVLEYNGSEVWVARNWGRPLRYESLALAAEEVSLRHADLVVTVSEALAAEVRARGVEERRVVWHPNGVHADAFAPERFGDGERLALRRRYGIPPDAIVVTFVGTFGQWHGVEVLARAIRESADWARAQGVHYLLVGDGLKMPEVRRELLGVEDVVALSGLVPQQDAPQHLAASDVLVSPHVPNADGSPFFGSPTKLFEYMAAGKAIVASDLDQIGDVLRDDLAVLVRPGDATDLARGIREAVVDETRRRELGARARRRVLERYTWAHHVGAMLDALARR